MTRRTRAPRRSADAGFSLIEVLVSLAIFALIAAAGFAVLDQILRTQRQTDGRLDRLAAMQRAVYLIRLDFLQAEAESFRLDEDGVGLRRTALREADGALGLRYALTDGVLVREVSHAGGAEMVTQPLLEGVGALAWQVYSPTRGWLDQWPPPEAAPSAPVQIGLAQPPEDLTPRAASLVLTLTPDTPGLAGEMRIVAAMPGDAR